MHDMPENETPVVDGVREWAVYRCAHGCLHVVIDRITLTLTADEFNGRLTLMGRASDRFRPAMVAELDEIRPH
jgi:hypothetical protein